MPHIVQNKHSLCPTFSLLGCGHPSFDVMALCGILFNSFVVIGKMREIQEVVCTCGSYVFFSSLTVIIDDDDNVE